MLKNVRNALTWDIRYRTILGAVVSLAANIVYAIYNFLLGITTASAWFVTMCFYYMLLSFMRFYIVLFERKNRKQGCSIANHLKECIIMKRTGIVLLFLTLALSGTVVLTLKQNHVHSYNTIVMLTIATYTFSKITMAVINYITVKKHNSPLLTTIRNINIADAAMSVLPLQSSMIASFDSQSDINVHMMIILTGTAICIFLLWIGISMIIISKTGGKING